MGAFPDDLEHFFEWLNLKNHAFFSNDFVPRRLYGEYLRNLFCTTVSNKPENVSLNLLDETIDVLADENYVQTILNSGEILYSDKVVLAFGNFPPPHPKSTDQTFIGSEKYFQNPWDQNIYRKIDSSDDVFIIGTGLSAVDAVLSLYHNSHAGKIYLFSTRGLLPEIHKLGFVYPSFYDELNSMMRITDLLKAVCRHIKLAEAQNSNWRAVIDSLRPHTQAIWCNLPDAEKRYFMQHLSRYWNVARHRMPPECAAVLKERQSAGQLEIIKGRLKNIVTSDRYDISFSILGEEKNLSADAIINCIGSQSNFALIDFPLIRNLLSRGLIRTDALKLGIDALPDGRTLNRIGSVSNKIFAAGTALRGALWESTAMPEIRVQVVNLTQSLLETTERN